MSVSTSTGSGTVQQADENCGELLSAIERRFKQLTRIDRAEDASRSRAEDDETETPARDREDERVHLFTTGVVDLFGTFFAALPDELRQFYTCGTCRKFIERYGGLVKVDAEGQTVPVMWDAATVPARYAGTVRALSSAVSKAEIQGVFLSAETSWGVRKTGTWQHMAVKPHASLVFKPSALRTTVQAIAEKQQDCEILVRSLEEFPLALVRQAHSLLTTGALFRSEVCVSIAKWLLDLHEKREGTRNPRIRAAFTWQAVASAPPGFSHVRSGMLGTLLEDLAAGMAFAQIKARFDAKMNPLQYQRPTAAPSAGNIARAEQIFAQLKSEGALERRFAKLGDLQTSWQPSSRAEGAGEGSAPKGVFSHLKEQVKSKGPAQVEVPPITMTWEKFARTVLPTAAGIEFLVPAGKQSFIAFVTAKNPEAPPILQWDSVEQRNPVSWYLYVNGSPASQWNLIPGSFQTVTAIALHPPMWNPQRPLPQHGEKVAFILKGARDTQYSQSSGFFPEFLKSEYHEIRSTLEAYAKGAAIAGKGEAEACGICLQKGQTWNYTFRVVSRDGLRTTYVLDRWD